MTSGLRSIATNGPLTSAFLAVLNSSTAFFCASLNLSAGIGGMRSCALTGPPIRHPATRHAKRIESPARYVERSSLRVAVVVAAADVHGRRGADAGPRDRHEHGDLQRHQ